MGQERTWWQAVLADFTVQKWCAAFVGFYFGAWWIGSIASYDNPGIGFSSIGFTAVGWMMTAWVQRNCTDSNVD